MNGAERLLRGFLAGLVEEGELEVILPSGKNSGSATVERRV